VRYCFVVIAWWWSLADWIMQDSEVWYYNANIREKIFAFCWCSVMKLLPIMHRTNNVKLIICVSCYIYCRFQWPHGLRRGSAASRLLVLWVRNRPVWRRFVFVSVVCCQVEFSATRQSVVQNTLSQCVCYTELSRAIITLYTYNESVGKS